MPNETLRLVGALDEVEEFERKNRKDAGHQIEDQTAQKCKEKRGAGSCRHLAAVIQVGSGRCRVGLGRGGCSIDCRRRCYRSGLQRHGRVNRPTAFGWTAVSDQDAFECGLGCFGKSFSRGKPE